MPSWRTNKQSLARSKNAKVLQDEINKRLALLDTAVERSVYDALQSLRRQRPMAR